jgi:hypothetical protein
MRNARELNKNIKIDWWSDMKNSIAFSSLWSQAKVMKSTIIEILAERNSLADIFSDSISELQSIVSKPPLT